MPQDPRTWTDNTFISARFLNTDLYSYVPYNDHYPNGLRFHAQPPMTAGYVNASGYQVASSVGGSTTDLFDNATTVNHWAEIVANDRLFGATWGARYGLFAPICNGIDGLNQYGGNHIVFGFPSWSAQANATGYAGASYNAGGPIHGGCQLPSTVRPNAPYVVDLLPTNQISATSFDLQALCQDSSLSNFPAQNNSTPAGFCCRTGFLWCGMGNKVETPPTVTPVPTPFSSTNAITANLNSGLRDPLRFLNNRPQFRATTNQSGSVATGTDLALQFSSITYDNYSGWSGTPNFWYVVPTDGVYLVHVNAQFTDALANQKRCGVKINRASGGGTITVYGPNYSSAAGSHIIAPNMTRLLDLKAGDQVQAVVTTAVSAGTLTTNGRMVLVWMSALASSGSALSFTPPDLTFRWPAGSPPGTLPGLFASRITNDLSFLLQKPYLTAYQTTNQTALAQNAYVSVVCNNNTGRIHGSFGDNYGGYNTSTGVYTCKVAGWYLIVGGAFQALSATTPYVTSWALQVNNTVPASIGQYQLHQKSSTDTASFPEGADGLMLVYLNKNDTVVPQYTQFDGAATWATTVATAGCESHFGLVWVSE